jgi:hypothetical protein
MMAGYTDFGAPKKPAKKKESKQDGLSVKVKGAPAEVHRVLGAIRGAGDRNGAGLTMNLPGPKGPRAPFKIPGSKSLTGRKAMKAAGAGDAPVPLTGGAQPVINTAVAYKRSKKAAAPSRNPEAPRKTGRR